MCIAIVQRSDVPIDKERLNICWERNPDGGGLSWRDAKNKLHIYKSLGRKKFFRKYNKLMSSPDVQYPILVHMRVKTSGPIDLDNCHPFWVNSDMVMMHNGTIHAVTATASKSDTKVFAEEYLTPLSQAYPDFAQNFIIQELIEKFIGSSRVITLDSEGECVILNEDTGHEETDGNWYSNKTYEKHTRRYSYGRGAGGNNNYHHVNGAWPDHHTGHNSFTSTKRTDEQGVFYFNHQKRRFLDDIMYAWEAGFSMHSHITLWREINSNTGNQITGGSTLTEFECNRKYRLWKEAEEAKYEKKDATRYAAWQAKEAEKGEAKVIDITSRCLNPNSETFICDFCGEAHPDDNMVLISASHRDGGKLTEAMFTICGICHESVIENWDLDNVEVLLGSDARVKQRKETRH
jgi:predicted glutamine amidotransferase